MISLFVVENDINPCIDNQTLPLKSECDNSVPRLLGFGTFVFEGFGYGKFDLEKESRFVKI